MKSRPGCPGWGAGLPGPPPALPGFEMRVAEQSSSASACLYTHAHTHAHSHACTLTCQDSHRPYVTFSPTAPGLPIPPGGPCGPSAPGAPEGPRGPGGPGGPWRRGAVELRAKAGLPPKRQLCHSPHPTSDPTHHLTHVTRLALLSRRSRQTLRTGGRQTLGRWARLQRPPNLRCLPAERPQKPRGCASQLRMRTAPRSRLRTSPRRESEKWARIYGHGAYCECPIRQ